MHMPNSVVHSFQRWLNPWIKDCGPFCNTLMSSQFFLQDFIMFSVSDCQ